MGILNRWRQFGKRYFWPHLLLGVVAAGISSPSILANTEQHALSTTTSTSVNRLNNSIQSISDNGLWLDVSRQSVQTVTPWHQQAIRRFLTRLAFVIVPQADDAFVAEGHHFNPLSAYEWAIVDSLSALLSSNQLTIPRQFSTVSIESDHSTEQLIGLWLVKLGGLRAGPAQYF